MKPAEPANLVFDPATGRPRSSWELVEAFRRWKNRRRKGWVWYFRFLVRRLLGTIACGGHEYVSEDDGFILCRHCKRAGFYRMHDGVWDRVG